ncbi:hypothetical protein [Paenibacillus dokdonensis]|uniref:hypothetical protein n=1 Tax=Paenibacillus dokdonensis TaxID=2567944 RepID=UPI0010A7D1AA|nr:hypothetical protein [Paenibacillus dokdonensis]
MLQRPEHQFVARTVLDELVYGPGRKDDRVKVLDSREREAAKVLQLFREKIADGSVVLKITHDPASSFKKGIKYL